MLRTSPCDSEEAVSLVPLQLVSPKNYDYDNVLQQIVDIVLARVFDEGIRATSCWSRVGPKRMDEHK